MTFANAPISDFTEFRISLYKRLMPLFLNWAISRQSWQILATLMADAIIIVKSYCHNMLLRRLLECQKMALFEAFLRALWHRGFYMGKAHNAT